MAFDDNVVICWIGNMQASLKRERQKKKELNLLELNLDWRLAMQRLIKDVRDDFWPDPLGFKDLLGSPDATVLRLEPILAAYRPHRGVSYAVPKANFTIRDSIYITPLDRLVYQALVDKLIPIADPLLSSNVFSHRLRGPQTKWIFRSGVQQWKRFFDAVKLALVERRGAFLVTTDVTQYFEAIRFKALRKQLENVLSQAGRIDLQSSVDALLSCLHEWSPYDGYGLVQNVDASSFLGNMLLDCVDRLMAKDGYVMFRYMDDIRIVVDSEAHARKALVRLCSHLRALGLGLNAAKTEVLGPDSPRLLTHLHEEDPDITMIEDAVGKRTRESAQDIVQILFQKTIRLIDERKVDERVFRFCLNRIASLRAYRNLELPNGEEITDVVLRLLVVRPVETDTFCRYLEVAPLNERHMAEIRRLLVSEPLFVYNWQSFHLWRLVSQRGLQCPELTSKAHRLLTCEPLSPETAGAALYLGARGDYADRQAIAGILSSVDRGLVGRCYQVAIQQLHKGERTKIYSDIAEGDWEAAVLTDYVGALHEPVYVDNPPKVEIEDLPDAMPSVYA